MKLQHALDLFLGEYPNENTVRNYRSTLQPLVLALGSARDIRHITTVEMIEYMQDIKNNDVRYLLHPSRPKLKSKLSPATVMKHIKSIKRFFNWLIEIGELEKNPADSLKRPKLDAMVDRNKAATPDEIELLLRVTFGHVRNHLLTRLLIDTGCRAGGIANLKIADIDLDKCRAIVTEKGDKIRPVWFSETTARFLRQWLVNRPIWKHDYVFGTDAGHMNAASVSQVIRRASISAGIRSLGSHSLRHAKGYQLADDGAPASVAAAALGHEDPTITLKYYYPRDLKRAEEAIRKTHQEDKKIIQLPQKRRAD